MKLRSLLPRRLQFVVALLAVLLEVIEVNCHECYVCKPDQLTNSDRVDLSAFDIEGEVKKCSDFKRAIKHQFVFKCPDGTGGCLTKMGANGSMRTCTNAQVDDCTRLHGLTYCTCKTELCNSPSKRLAPVENHPHMEVEEDEVEEDEVEELDDEHDDYDWHVDEGSGDLDQEGGDDEEDVTDMPVPSVDLQQLEEEYKKIAREQNRQRRIEEEQRIQEKEDIFIVEEDEKDANVSGATALAQSLIFVITASIWRLLLGGVF